MDTINSNQNEVIEGLTRLTFSNFLIKCFNTVNPGAKFKENWHIKLISEALKACEDGKMNRLIINIPPRYLKSLLVNVAWPAWLLGHDPTRRIISASYSQTLATKHSIDTRLIMSSLWYRKIFQETQICRDQNEKDKFMTTQRGFRFATSTGGTLTGEGGNFLILDDPHNPAHLHSKSAMQQTIDWYRQVFATRLDDKQKGVIVLIMQRLHCEDLTGFLTSQGDSWHQISIPVKTDKKLYFHSGDPEIPGHDYAENSVLQENRENDRLLKKLESEIGSFAFSAQYLQNPLPIGNGLINRDWLRFYKYAPAKFTAITQSWDTAVKGGSNNDYSVCTTWGETENCYYLLDIFKEKLEYPALKRAIVNNAEKWQPDAILVEDRSSGQSLIQDIRYESKLPILSMNPKGDKLMRLASVTPLMESGKIFFPEKAPWIADFETELLSFPNSVHDDQVDSLTQFLIWAKSKKNFFPKLRGVKMI